MRGCSAIKPAALPEKTQSSLVYTPPFTSLQKPRASCTACPTVHRVDSPLNTAAPHRRITRLSFPQNLNSPTDTHICLTLSLCSTQCTSPVSQTTREHLCEASEPCSAARAPAPSCTGRYGHDWSAHPPSSDRFCPPYTCTQTISYTLCILGCRGCLPNPSEASKSFNG